MTKLIFLILASIFFLFAILREQRKGNILAARVILLIEFALILAVIWSEK